MNRHTTRIRVRSAGDRFRRAGITFTKSPGEFEVDDSILDQLLAEPALFVEVLSGPEEMDEKKLKK